MDEMSQYFKLSPSQMSDMLLVLRGVGNSHACRVVVDMKLFIHIHIHIHRCPSCIKQWARRRCSCSGTAQFLSQTGVARVKIS